MPYRNIFVDGTKSIDLPQYPDSAWTFYANPPEMDREDLYGRVAAVFRAANMTANATANIPFALVNEETGEDYDTSSEWKNQVGFMPDPVELLRLWRLSLIMTNTAYGFMEGRQLRGTQVSNTNLKYIVPTSIKPIADDENGLTGFTRTLGAKSKDYKPVDKGGNIFYMWHLDHTTELLPSKKTEYMAMMNAAGILYYSDDFIKKFFARGAIKPTMLMLNGTATKENIEKLESTWTKVIQGAYKYLGKIFQGGKESGITPVVLGDGAENLKDETITSNKLADIAMAIGMPLSILLANSATYATAQVERASWYRDELSAWCNFIAGCLNKQIFTAMGLRFEFRPEMTDPGQEDEVARAGAFSTYVSSGVLPSLAAQIVGVEMPAGYDFEDLDPEDKTEPKPTTTPTNNPAENTQDKEDQSEMTKELHRWKRKATKALKSGKSPWVEFVSDIIPDDARQFIERGLRLAKTEEDIKAAFILSDAVKPEPEKEVVDTEAIKMLAAAIEKAMTAVDTNTKEAPVIQVNVPPANVVVNVPKQPAPVVNVTVPEAPPPKITVQVPKPAHGARVIRDVDGRISGIEEER